MAVLLDTNVLLRLVQPHHASAQIATRALRTLRADNETLNITQQHIVEFWGGWQPAQLPLTAWDIRRNRPQQKLAPSSSYSCCCRNFRSKMHESALWLATRSRAKTLTMPDS
jgi:hypothetical protein